MNLTPLNGPGSAAAPLAVAGSEDFLQTGGKPTDKAKLVEASKQFEGVLLRQFLSESLKSLTDAGGSGGQVYGYFLNDTIANSITKGGGLGLASVFQAQIAGQKGAL